ncbi:MAG TPA: glycosyltransferase family A protein [Lutibacter sp.]
MRTIPNPEKFNFTEIVYKPHRIIIPVYIPESNDFYYSSLFEVFKMSIFSLLKTVNNFNAAITIINNNCKNEVTEYIDSLLAEKKIDKHVKLSENYGKVHTILSEARGCYEPYITIADADVFYFNNWEEEVFEIFKTFPKVGVVSPVPSPHLFKYCNISFIIDNIFNLKKGKILTDQSFRLFAEGINKSPNFFFKGKIDFKETQYYIEKNKTKACLGATHFIATYKNEMFKWIPLKKPKFKFKIGDEGVFIDSEIDKIGYGRLSTIDSYAYHLGYSNPDWTMNYQFRPSKFLFPSIKSNNLGAKQTGLVFNIKKLIYKLLKRLKIIDAL